MQHRVDAGNGVELSSGTVFGGRGSLAIGRYVELAGGAVSGSLTPDSAQADAATFTRAHGSVIVLPVEWLAIRVGAAVHTFSSDLAVQRWTRAHLGGEGRLRFIGGRLTGVLRFELYPVISVSGLTRPNRAFGAASGLRFESGAFTSSVAYELERYDFPRVSGVERKEQVGMLTASLGLRFGTN